MGARHVWRDAFSSATLVADVRLHWHRQDLRLADNPALVSDDHAVVGCVIDDPEIADIAGPERLAFYHGSVDALASAYRNQGGHLVRRTGDPRQAVPTVARELGVDRVSWEADYTGFSRRRDRAVSDSLESLDIAVIEIDGAVLHPPGSITTNQGDPYQVFSYFGKKWLDREKAPPASEPDTLHDPGSDLTTAPTENASSDRSLPEAGSTAAQERMDAFFADAVYNYAENRDRPAADATSRLSPHLSMGTIGIRTVWERTEEAMSHAEAEADEESVAEFQRQLAWREFYTQLLWDRPEIVTENARSFPKPIAWRDDPAELEAWKTGETGYPIIDAGMRQLANENWMHNRVRMIVASFLCKDLRIDWREGYRWFREQLVDHDTANDVGGWQWAASTGADAQPYFRIFNPMTQGERHDPDARYIKRYVPELKSVPPDVIHQWDEVDGEERRHHAPDYPAPIVDHAHRRKQAIAMYERARDSE